ncbi:MAG: DUF4097 family beta strand repeat-containing protein [Paraglaciecola sp.]|uniref:DUF4097 family beta strand repeat-containing protein n=1 Tax=Paraglaciecola sp. TaxID=1920173 RepID=UPI003297506E
MKNVIKLTTYLNAILLYFVLFYSTSIFATTFNKSFDVEFGGQLRLSTDTGSIEIATHDEPVVELQIKTKNTKDDEFSYRFEQSGGDLTIIGEINENRNWLKNNNVKFILVIPKTYNVELDTSGGSLSIEDLIGQLQANTSGGSINVQNIQGDVKLHTSGGSIKTGNISGNIKAHTSGGSINVSIDKQLTKDAKLTTSGGSISAYLDSDIQVNIDAKTSGGRVKSDFKINGMLKKMHVRGSINGGGPNLTLKTSGGSIKIKKI